MYEERIDKFISSKAISEGRWDRRRKNLQTHLKRKQKNDRIIMMELFHRHHDDSVCL